MLQELGSAMAAIWNYFSVRDYYGVGAGARLTGLSPTWVLFKKLDDSTDITTRPAILEVGQGIYKYSYDAETNGDAAGQIDVLGGGNPNNVSLSSADRYLDLFATREPSRVLAAINTSGQVVLSPSGLDSIQVESGVNARQALSPILAASAGVLLGAGTGTIVIKGGNVAVTRITATTDSAGNRSAVTLSLP
jgi:hypothetical protein